MTRRVLFTFIAILALACPAAAQNQALFGASSPYGSATTTIAATGLNFTAAGSLFASTSVSLQFAGAFTVSFGVKTPGGVPSPTYFLSNLSTSPNKGLSIRFSNSFSNTSNYETAVLPGGGTVGGTCGSSQTCVRNVFIEDNIWHTYCTTWNGSNQITTYVDGVQRDQTVGSTTFTNNTNFWEITLGGQAASMRDLRVYTKNIGGAGCTTLSLLATAGKTPSAGTLQSNLAVYLPMNNCNGTGCADSSGNSNNFVFDTTAPTVAITAPANGATGLSGAVSMTATCSDSFACASVSWYVDGAFVAASSASPYTTTWTTTNYIDGAHSIVAIGVNVGGVLGTSPTITASTSNSVSAKTVFLDPTSGTDCPANNGLSSGAPCSTWTGVQTVINATPLHGGDSILQKAGTNLNLTNIDAATALNLCGTLSTAAAGNNCPNQNYYPGQAITLGTYSGSGNCHVLSAVTTDCASTTITSGGSTADFNTNIINATNTPNLVIQNMRFFGSQPLALNCNYSISGCVGAVGIKTAGNFNNSSISGGGIILQNIETTDFLSPVTIYNTTAQTYPTSGSICGVVAQDNYIHGSSPSAAIGTGIVLFGVGCNSGAISGVISNYAANIGGEIGQTDGSPIVFVNGSNFITDNYNVTLSSGLNNTTCGGMFGNWWYQTGNTNTVLGNESGLIIPALPQGCDKGAFNLDNGTSGFTLNFNYSHETWGPALNILLSAVGTYNAGKNTVAYNIFENGNALEIDTRGVANMLSMGATIGFIDVYNNNMWNGYNGSIVAPNTLTTFTAGLGTSSCPPSTSVMANNITVSAGNGEMFYGSFPAFVASCSTIKFLKNDWFPIGASLFWKSIVTNLDTITTLGAWNTAVGATDIQTNPSFAGSGGAGVQCWATLSGIPVQPGSIPCPSNYELNNNTNALIGVGIDLTQAPYSRTLPAKDYFTTTIPNGVGTGYNIGADGGHH